MGNKKNDSGLFEHQIVPSKKSIEDQASETAFSQNSTPSLGLSAQEFDLLVKDGNIPKNISELDEMKSTLKILVDWNKLMAKNATLEERNEFLKKNARSQEELEKQLALHHFLLEHKDSLLKILEHKDHKRNSKFRHSGHLVDQKLKYSDPSKSNMPLLDLLSKETKEKIHNSPSVDTFRMEGIRLTPPQDKLINALVKLLHEKSENKDEASENFYTGNIKGDLVPYGGDGQKARSAAIRITPTELYKAYMDNEDYSGADIKFIKGVLQDTAEQKFLLIYERRKEVRNEKGKKEVRINRVEDFQSLIKIISFFEGLTEDEKRKLDKGSHDIREKRGELVIAFNPILTDQINTKYIEYPSDINRKTVIAAGGHRFVTESMIALRDYMFREISNKRYVVEINEDKFIYLLKLDNYIRAKRKKLIQQRVDGSIQFGRKLGLIESYERVIGAQGQWKYHFCLNEKFE